MQTAEKDYRGGPGSKVMLAEQTIKVRDSVIAKFADKPLEEVNEFIKQMLEREEDEQKRLGLLAARVFILRQRILRLFGEGQAMAKPASQKDAAPTPAETDGQPAEMAGEDQQGDEAGPSEWRRLRILKNSEVNGIKFLEGMIVDVNNADAEKLVAAGKAEFQDGTAAEKTGAEEAAADEAGAEEAAAEEAGADEADAEEAVADEAGAEEAAAEETGTSPDDETDK